jgi:hypothetical protein
VGVVDPWPSLRVESFGWSQPDPASVVEGFPVALFDFAVVVPAERAPVGLIGPAAGTAGRPLMPSGVPSLQDHGGHAQQHESYSGKDAE